MNFKMLYLVMLKLPTMLALGRKSLEAQLLEDLLYKYNKVFPSVYAQINHRLRYHDQSKTVAIY